MWPVTTKPAAKALGISPETLRRWLRDGRFDHIDGLTMTRVGLQETRCFSRKWIVAVAKEIGITPDFSALEDES
jgi:hypothetical protein